MSELIEGLKQTLKNEDARYVYADHVVNTLVSAQIKALREDRKLSQQELADLVGTKQSGISRLEKADYSTWKIETLRKLARAFGVRLRISFDEFGTLPPDIKGFTREKLCPRRFEDDPAFKEPAEAEVSEKAAYLAMMQARIKAVTRMMATTEFEAAGAGHVRISEEALARFLPGERAASSAANTVLGLFAKPVDPVNMNRALDQTEMSTNVAPEGGIHSAPALSPAPTGASDPRKGFQLISKRPAESINNPLLTETKKKRA